MKRRIALFLCIVLLISSCSKSKYVDGSILPSDLLSNTEISHFVGYVPSMTQKSSRREAVATYVSDKPGAGETVYVKLVQENGLMTKDKVKAYFDECRNMRSDSFEVEDLGVKAFIAYPSIHYYIDGFHITVTAGSGNDDNQRALLVNLAKITLEHLSELKNIPIDNIKTDAE